MLLVQRTQTKSRKFFILDRGLRVDQHAAAMFHFRVELNQDAPKGANTRKQNQLDKLVANAETLEALFLAVEAELATTTEVFRAAGGRACDEAAMLHVTANGGLIVENIDGVNYVHTAYTPAMVEEARN